MAQRTLVHKQFNSPIGLYSDRNVRETLDRELRTLSNGVVGIDFEHNPTASKPANLANSAVLRMLEEEEQEQRRSGSQPGLRRVAWPPPSDVTVHPSQVPLNYNQQPQDQQQYQPAAAPAPAATSLQDGASYSAQPAAAPLSPVGVPQAYTQAQYAQPQSYTSPQYNQPQYNQPQYPQSPVSQPPQASRQFPAPAPSYLNRPAVPRGSSPSTAAFSGGVALGQPQAQQSQVPAWRRAASQPSAPLSPPTAQFSSPDPSASTLSPGGTSPTPRGWAPVKAATPTYGQTYTQQVPAATHYQAPTYEADPYQDQFQAQNQFQTQSYQTTTSYQATETQQHQQYYQPAVRQPSPGVITLRTELPVSQAPAPVYASQPPVFSFKGGSNMRGDQKWPPVEYKQQAAAENEARLRLAAGPACRPRRCNKDYTAFFAKNALSHNYPGYRVPPGTQHVNGQSMM
ncbi:trithorax group protein osa isoform X2 [Phlebotomus argentipes]|uniref:trithorax group protein osa isoform X2 n=1 Tax=Phlebotomus argentipes TaxID=94469 RepID=UPI002892CBB5|nr:trithorax group protein osa isoform X2 [Phlebotomus argentipes]XP_059615596.1 trithorax group protein osa isoform X2 [Phlebotomus argentipes]